MTETKISDLYEGKLGQIWFDTTDPDDETITISFFGRVTINLDKEDFQELYNAMIISKQALKDLEKRK